MRHGETQLVMVKRRDKRAGGSCARRGHGGVLWSGVASGRGQVRGWARSVRMAGDGSTWERWCQSDQGGDPEGQVLG